MTSVFKVADMLVDCSTRERGRKVYPALSHFVDTELSRGAVPVVSFEGVKLVTPSFLDEAIIRVVRERPQGVMQLNHIQDFPMQSLSRMLQATGKQIAVQGVGQGMYRVAAAA